MSMKKHILPMMVFINMAHTSSETHDITNATRTNPSFTTNTCSVLSDGSVKHHKTCACLTQLSFMHTAIKAASVSLKEDTVSNVHAVLSTLGIHLYKPKYLTRGLSTTFLYTFRPAGLPKDILLSVLSVSKIAEKYKQHKITP